MAAHRTAQIRNVVLLGHAGVGKTTLAEALLHQAGVISRAGLVAEGSTVLDRDPEAIDRGSSVSLGLASFDWSASDGNSYRINLLDTPGHPGFVAEVDAALAVADLAVLVVSATDGVEVGTEVAWRKCAKLGLPRMIFVTREDKPRAGFEGVLQQLSDSFGRGFTPIELPLGEEGSFHGVADVLTEEALEYEADGHHHIEPLPAEIAEHEHKVHEKVVEEIVSGDDDQLERYLDGEVVTSDQLEQTLAAEMLACEEFPVLVGSGTTAIGVDRLADYICELGPSPADRPTEVEAGGETLELSADPTTDPLLFVFKTISDQYVGQISLFKVITGTLQPDTAMRESFTGTDERLHGLFTVCGSNQTIRPSITAGDIGAVNKLSVTRTGSTLTPPANPVVVPPVPIDPPHLAVALVPTSQSDDDKLSDALHRLVNEDPALSVGFDSQTRRSVLRGTSDAHLAVAIARLERKHGVRATTDDVGVAYRRTISRPVDVEGRVKKQSGGHGQFAVVNLRVSPTTPGSRFEFVDAIVGGAIPKHYVAAVRHGVEEAMANGSSDGVEIVDVAVECYDGKTHSVDSSDMAFKTAAALGFNDAVELAEPVLLEPISLLMVRVPSNVQGDVLSDLSARRGKISSSSTDGDGTQQITATVPSAELERYVMDLRALTAARGTFDVQHDHYEPVPEHLVPAVLAGLASRQPD